MMQTNASGVYRRAMNLFRKKNYPNMCKLQDSTYTQELRLLQDQNPPTIKNLNNMHDHIDDLLQDHIDEHSLTCSLSSAN